MAEEGYAGQAERLFYVTRVRGKDRGMRDVRNEERG